MSGPRGGRRSRGELIRQRAGVQFVGRRDQLALFADNLPKDPESEADPAEFLFHVRGVGGVGKSTLLRQWREAARRAGAVTAVVDEDDVHGVPQALEELARQLAAASGGPLKEFERAVEQRRRERESAAEPVAADGTEDGGASASSRVLTQATLGAAALIPVAGAVTAMVNPDAAAQGLDRLRAGTRSRGRRTGTAGDPVSCAFVSELGRLGERHRWVVLFLDTWERTGRYLDGWLRELLDDGFGPLPANVMVVLAGRDELAERQWAPLRAVVTDVPLEVFTEAETRTLLAARGVVEPEAVEAVLHLSMGLPLLVELCIGARPVAAADLAARGDVVDAAVDRFVQWIEDDLRRRTVLACALAPRLNEDVFAAAVPPDARELWEWLCGQPFVSGRSDFKQYHAVVRASMVRRQRTDSPDRWTAAHLRLADAHAAWRTAAERGLEEGKRWDDARWRRHSLDETYHRLCARPAAGLDAALEQGVLAAGQSTEALRQWIDTLEQAARDTADPVLRSWADRLQTAVADSEPVLAGLTVLLTHDRLSRAGRGRVHTYRGWELHAADRDDEALAELDRAVATDPGNHRAWAYRGDVHRLQNRYGPAVGDLTTALGIDPTYAWALGSRGQAHTGAGDYDRAVADFTAALDIDPGYAWALAQRGEAHRAAGRYDEAVADLSAALDLSPTLVWALGTRGEAQHAAGRYDLAVADFTAALELDPSFDWLVGWRGESHREAGRYDEAVADLTAAYALDPEDRWVLGCRGQAHRQAERYDEAVADLTAALALDPAYAWALAERGEAHRGAGRFDEAAADLTAALALKPDYTWALAARGRVYDEAGRFDEAVADFTAALALDPGHAWALAHRGETHREVGRYEAAVADFTTALALDPAYAWALGSRGQAYRAVGRYDEAVADLTAALDLDPDVRWARIERAGAHRQAGRYREAREDLALAAAQDPDDLEAPFETLLLDAAESGWAACADRWEALLATPSDEPEVVRHFALFRMLILGQGAVPGDDVDVVAVAVAAERYLSDGHLSSDTVVELLRYLDELSGSGGAPAERARYCREIIADRRPPAAS
ncbi:tetratricopeptide repeat protein [Actinacidiphila alni]|uniref:tetratricopeptide repeat protein n=1 Tax=Actinacidiphila alni TaxID=380248 RepID=UPI00345587AC